jgi:hypothetical protein
MKFLSFLIILITSYCWASSVDDFYSAYRGGDYENALKIADEMISNKNTDAEGYYLKGLIESRLTFFDRAEKSFVRAYQKGARQKDLHYLRGQALFAINMNKEALKSFDKSIKRGFKVRECLYYKGVIHQKDGDLDNAEKSFSLLLTYAGAEIALRESTLKRLAEISLEKASIEKLKKQIASPTIMLKNSRYIPLSPWQIIFSLETGYDSNVTLEANESVVSATHKDSPFLKLMGLVDYRFIFNNEWLLSPEIRIDRTLLTRRNVPEIIQNDSESFSPAVRARYEHTLAGLMSSTIADIEGNYTRQDLYSQKDLVFYGRSIGVFVGEKMKTLPTGETSLKFKFKKYWSAVDGDDTDTKGFILEQSWASSRGELLLADLIVDFNKLENDYNSYNNYETRIWYRLPDFTMKMDLTLGFDLIFTDPSQQRSLRGLEIELTPSVKLTRTMSNSFTFSPRYEFTKKFSKDKVNYAFTRHVASIEFGMDF